MFSIDKKFKKKIGSREEVFNGVAERTGERKEIIAR